MSQTDIRRTENLLKQIVALSTSAGSFARYGYFEEANAEMQSAYNLWLRLQRQALNFYDQAVSGFPEPSSANSATAWTYVWQAENTLGAAEDYIQNEAYAINN